VKEASPDFAAFLAGLKAGSLAPFVKSEPAPEGLDNGVTVAVGTTFDSVMDAEKDVLMEFYAPWCGHCKSLAPKYEALAQQLAGVSTLTIAKLDATANDWSDKEVYAVKGFPTIYFKPAGKPPVTYDGERETAAMAKWLSQHATHTFAVPDVAEAAKPKKSKKSKSKKADDAGHDEL
jgi:protein disulfide isomerase